MQIPILADVTKEVAARYGVLKRDAGIALVLYPLSAFRAMSAAARDVYAAIRRDGSQKAVTDRMQTRAELYEVLKYEEYERKADQELKR